MTPQEKKLWYSFLSKQSARFQRQKTIGNFIVDFYCHKAKLIIEIDGKQHREEQGIAYDKERDAYLAAFGLTILRFSNQDVEYGFGQVCAKIASLLPPPPAEAPPSKRGADNPVR